MKLAERIKRWRQLQADVDAETEAGDNEEFWIAKSSGAMLAVFDDVLDALEDASNKLAVANIYGARQANNGKRGVPMQTFDDWYESRRERYQAVRP